MRDSDDAPDSVDARLAFKDLHWDLRRPPALKGRVARHDRRRSGMKARYKRPVDALSARLAHADVPHGGLYDVDDDLKSMCPAHRHSPLLRLGDDARRLDDVKGRHFLRTPRKDVVVELDRLTDLYVLKRLRKSTSPDRSRRVAK